MSGDFTRSYVKANAECLRLGFKFAAIQNGNQLFCNLEYPSYPEANPDDCLAKKCPEQLDSGCGGYFRQIVIRTIAPPLGLINCDSEFGIVMIGPQQSSFSLSGPVKGWSMRATSRHPQVLVSTNDVMSRCQNGESCKFYYDSDLTPILESVAPTEGIEGDLLTIQFNDNHWKPRWMNVTTISIAGMDCPVLQREDYSLTCEFGRTPAGLHYVVAHVAGVGSSLSTVKFKSLLKVTKVYPTAGSVHGGTILVIEGKGFASAGPDNKIMLGDKVPCVPRIMENPHCKGFKYEGFVNCDLDSVYGYAGPTVRHYAKQFDFSNYDRIECVVGGGNHIESKVGLTVNVGDQAKSLPKAFEFSMKRTPVIETINPNPAGRSVPILLRGYNLEADPVLDKQWYMNIWGFYERFPNVSVFLDRIDVATMKYDRQIFGKNLCFIGDVSTEDRMGKHQQWSETNGTQITCTIGDIPETSYPVHVYIHGKGFARVKQNVTVGVVVKSVVPSQVSLYGGIPITIYGSGFSRFDSHNSVNLGGDKKCRVISSTHTKIVCLPGPGSKENYRVTVHVTCGNLAFCNSEPQPSTGNARFTFNRTITPKAEVVEGHAYNKYLGAAVAPGSAIKLYITMPGNQMAPYANFSQAKIRSLIKVWLAGKSFNDINLTRFDYNHSVATLEGVVPILALGPQVLQVETPTGRSQEQTVIVFPYVGTPDVTSTGLGGGLVVTLKSHGIGGWIENERTPRAAMSLIRDGFKFTTSNCYPMNNLKWDKSLGPVLDMSTHKCWKFCNGYRYFGVNDGETCVCSNTPPKKAVLRTKCNKFCSADFSHKGNVCGGNFYITLFERCCHTDVYVVPTEHKAVGPSPWRSLSAPVPG